MAPTSAQIGPPAGAVVLAPASNAAPSTEAYPGWTEVEGVVLALGPRTLVLRADDGQRVVVDVSALSPGLAGSTLIGSLVKVYSVPIELRFKATGLIEKDGRRR